MTLFDRIRAMEADDGRPLEDLCRPLSAKVMPRRAYLGATGQEKTEAQALKDQRNPNARRNK